MIKVMKMDDRKMKKIKKLEKIIRIMKQTTENLNFSHKIEPSRLQTSHILNYSVQKIYRRYYGAIQRDAFWTHIGIHVHNTWKRNLLSQHGYWLWLGIASVWHINLTIHIRSVTHGTLCQKLYLLKSCLGNLEIWKFTESQNMV